MNPRFPTILAQTTPIDNTNILFLKLSKVRIFPVVAIHVKKASTRNFHLPNASPRKRMDASLCESFITITIYNGIYLSKKIYNGI